MSTSVSMCGPDPTPASSPRRLGASKAAPERASHLPNAPVRLPPRPGQVVAVIAALYSQGADPLQQREANAWLSALAASPSAWEQGLAILALPPPEASGGAAAAASSDAARYFAANMLLSKVRSDWGKLPEEGRTHVSAGLWAALQQAAAAAAGGGPPPSLVAGRVCLALAAAAAASGPEASVALLHQVAAVAGGAPALALELLQVGGRVLHGARAPFV